MKLTAIFGSRDSLDLHTEATASRSEGGEWKEKERAHTCRTSLPPFRLITPRNRLPENIDTRKVQTRSPLQATLPRRRREQKQGDRRRPGGRLHKVADGNDFDRREGKIGEDAYHPATVPACRRPALPTRRFPGTKTAPPPPRSARWARDDDDGSPARNRRMRKPPRLGRSASDIDRSRPRSSSARARTFSLPGDDPDQRKRSGQQERGAEAGQGSRGDEDRDGSRRMRSQGAPAPSSAADHEHQTSAVKDRRTNAADEKCCVNEHRRRRRPIAARLTRSLRSEFISAQEPPHD